LNGRRFTAVIPNFALYAMFVAAYDKEDIYNFLDKLKTESDIKLWVNNVLSHIVMKFDEQFENISDFIYEFTIMNYRLYGINDNTIQFSDPSA